MAQIVRLDTHRAIIAERRAAPSRAALPARIDYSEPPAFARIALGIAVLVVMLPFAIIDMLRARRIDVSEQDVADHYFDRRPK